MTKLYPLVGILDPELHTFEYVSSKSSYLLSVMLAAAAKVFNQSLYSNLKQHAESLFLQTFSRCTKSVEVVQAIIFSTLWKEPNDARAWSSLGYAIRIAMELGLHKLSPKQPDGPLAGTETQQREKRCRERLWLMLFVYDHRFGFIHHE